MRHVFRMPPIPLLAIVLVTTAAASFVATDVCAQVEAPVSGPGLPAGIAGDLLEDAMQQKVGDSRALSAGRGTGLKFGLVGMCVLVVVAVARLRKSSTRHIDPSSRGATTPASHEGSHRPPGALADGEDRYRPYRSRRLTPEQKPLVLPAHVLEILARSNAPAEPTPAPYRAADGPFEGPDPVQPNEPREGGLDLVVPGFTPWSKQDSRRRT